MRFVDRGDCWTGVAVNHSTFSKYKFCLWKLWVEHHPCFTVQCFGVLCRKLHLWLHIFIVAATASISLSAARATLLRFTMSWIDWSTAAAFSMTAQREMACWRRLWRSISSRWLRGKPSLTYAERDGLNAIRHTSISIKPLYSLLRLWKSLVTEYILINTGTTTVIGTVNHVVRHSSSLRASVGSISSSFSCWFTFIFLF